MIVLSKVKIKYALNWKSNIPNCNMHTRTQYVHKPHSTKHTQYTVRKTCQNCWVITRDQNMINVSSQKNMKTLLQTTLNK